MRHAGRQSGKVSGGCLLAILGVLVLGVAGAYFLGTWGLDIFTEDVKRDIRDHALILEHIGNIEEMSLDMKATGAEPEDIFVFQLRGPKGTCELMAALVTTADGTERVQAGTIRLPDGRSFDLFPDGRRDLPALESDE